MSVKRYDTGRGQDYECSSGRYVLHSDYATLRAELAELKEAARFALMSWSCDCKAERSEMFKKLAALVGEE